MVSTPGGLNHMLLPVAGAHTVTAGICCHSHVCTMDVFLGNTLRAHMGTDSFTAVIQCCVLQYLLCLGAN